MLTLGREPIAITR